MSGQLVDLKDDGPLQLNIFLVGVYKPGASAYLRQRCDRNVDLRHDNNYILNSLSNSMIDNIRVT